MKIIFRTAKGMAKRFILFLLMLSYITLPMSITLVFIDVGDRDLNMLLSFMFLPIWIFLNVACILWVRWEYEKAKEE